MSAALRSLGLRWAQIAIELAVLTAALVLAYMFRFDWQLSLQTTKQLFFQLPYVVVFELLVLYAWGINRMVWRFISMRDAVRIGYAVATAAAVLLAVRVVAAEVRWGHARYALVPIGIIAMNGVLVYLGVTGVRSMRRLTFEWTERRNLFNARGTKRVLVFGAGRAGQMVAKEISSRPDLGMRIVGFLDDDPRKIGHDIHGFKVLGHTDTVDRLGDKLDVDEAVIAMAQVGGDVVRRIHHACKAAGLPVRIIPGMYEIIGGHVSVSRLREIRIEDLLGRDPVELDQDALAEFIQNRVVLVTGAGGSIGSELCRQVAAFGPRRLVLVERVENPLFEVHNELTETFPGLALEPRIADVTDEGRMRRVMAEFGCEVIFHAAAHKHVPMMEWNPGEAVKNNVLGTKVVADLAGENGARHFVMVSTDKAVNPTSVMGASKRVAELYVQAMARRHRKTTYVSVRFGNVLGSSGSVVPLLRRQIAKGGPVTVTHPDMRRYFMTIPEAAQLVLQAGALGKDGEVLILDMGEPVSVLALAKDMIRLSGLEPGQDVEIRFTGIRPGEKLFEELATDEERAKKTTHSKIFVGRVRASDWQVLNAGIGRLLDAVAHGDERRVYHGLRRLIPEFHRDGTQGLTKLAILAPKR